MTIASKKHTRFCFSWYWQIYSTIIKYTESEESLRGVLQELWYNIPSGTITSLRADNRLPSTDPDIVNILRQFDSPFNFHTKYGQRLTGYLQVLSSNIIFPVKFGLILCLYIRTLRCCTKRGKEFWPRILKGLQGSFFFYFLLRSLFSGRLCVFSNHFLYANPNISFPLIFPFSCKMHPLLTSLAHSVTGIVTHTTHVTNFICCSFCLA